MAQRLGRSLDKVNLNLMGKESTGPGKFSTKEGKDPCAQAGEKVRGVSGELL